MKVDRLTYRASEYDVVDIQGGDYLVFSSVPVPVWEAVETDPAQELMDLIGLVVDPLPPYYRDYDDPAPMQAAIPQERIVAFCNTHGAPWRPSDSPSHPVRIAARLSGFSGEAALDLADFRFAAAWLYTHFQTWQEMAQGRRGPFVQRSLIRLLTITGGQVADEEAELALSLACEVDRVLSTLTPVIGANLALRQYDLSLRCTDVVQLAYWQFAQLMAADQGAAVSRIRRCANPSCERLFLPRHGHSKYCNYCDRRTVHRLRQAR